MTRVTSCTLRPFYPNEAPVTSSRCKPAFNWFLFGQRRLDLIHNLFFVAVPPSTRFLDTKQCVTKHVKDTSTPQKKMEAKDFPRYLIVSDPHNKKVLCARMGECQVGCASKKEKLSAECKIVSDSAHIRRLFRLAIKLGYDGIVSHHVCCTRSLSARKFPVSQECTFTSSKAKVETVEGDGCRIIRFAKQHNTQIRRVQKTFPTNTDIDLMRKRMGCTKTTKALYNKLVRYATIKRR